MENNGNMYPVKRSENLEFTRFIAAMAVIFSHSFRITLGKIDSEWLYYITNGQLDFGALAVAAFFLCGGYLAMRSMDRFEGVFKYIKKRLFRMLPVLWVVIFASVILGAVITTCTPGEYFTDPLTYIYLLNCILIPRYALPGVFEGSLYKSDVNGALWTLPVEFACNTACCIGKKLGLLNKKILKYTIPVILVLAIVFYIVTDGQPVMRDIARPCILFYAGMILCAYGDRIRWSPYICIGMLALLIASSAAGLLFFGMIIAFPYICIYWWFYSKQIFGRAAVMGRYTYSMYLWGFPMQQLVAKISGWSISPYADAGIAILISVILAIISYHIVEVNVEKKVRKV